MSSINEKLINDLNSFIEEQQIFNYITRDTELQKEACIKLSAFSERLAALKSTVLLEGDENAANLILGFECVTQFLRSQITMWILLKAEQPDEAWSHLINAQRAAGDAVRAHPGFTHLKHHVERLHAIEELVFPPQVFTSMGIIVRRRTCSICGEEYGECTHLVGKPYQGEICHTFITEIERIDHLAIVDNPANKNCRLVEFDVPEGTKNRMTWKVEPSSQKNGAQQSDAGIKAKAILYGPGEIFE